MGYSVKDKSIYQYTNSTRDLLNIPILKITKPNNTVIMSNSANSADQTGEKSFLSNLVSGKTPGAASQLGSQDQKSGASEHQGVGSAKFKEGISDQRQEPSIIGKMFNNVMNGTDSTK